MTESKANIVVSSRGQVTLPADVRRRLGIKEGGVLTLEERDGQIVLTPAAVVELSLYSDEEIDRWDADDELPAKERRRLEKKLGRR